MVLKMVFSDVHAAPVASSGIRWPAVTATAMISRAAIVAAVGTTTASFRALRSGARLAPYSTSTSTAAKVSAEKPDDPAVVDPGDDCGVPISGRPGATAPG